MRFVADLHLHSRFSRATSRDLTLPQLHAWAQRKGIFLLGTGDITHPQWLEEVAEQLVPAEDGLFALRPDLARAADAAVPPACRRPVRFVLQGEVSSIYKHDGAVRKVHSVVFCPGLAEARRFLAALDRLGNVRSDGRPILGLPAREVLEILLDAGPGCRLVPAHVWTPWFSVLGAKSGYDSIEACFGDLAGEITALETGLSSDPSMNWRVSALDRFALISNSDAHSAPNLGREANEFDLDPSYPELFASLRPGDPRFLGTLEFFPEHGKYHLDGHRKCGLRLTPAETRAAEGRCPACGGKITVGVLHRVEELADRPPGAAGFASLVPLAEVVGECLAVGKGSRRVQSAVEHLLHAIGPEFPVLRTASREAIERVAGPVVAEGVMRAREGRLQIAGGYDGEFGTVRIFAPEERAEIGRQGTLFAAPATPAPDAGPQRAAASPREEPAGTAPSAAASPGEPRGAEPQPLPLFPAGRESGVLEGLNREQRDAVSAPPGPLLIVAGPGTGKTRTLTRRLAHKVLSDGLAPERVAAVTFTNRAAEELRERLRDLLGAARAARVTVGTLHQLGLAILRAEAEAAGLSEGFSVLGAEEGAEFFRGAVPDAGADANSRLEAISRARRGEEAAPEVDEDRRRYEAALAEAGAVDLDDLVLRPARLLGTDAEVRARWQGRFDHLAVDEFQDLDAAQMHLISLLAPAGADLTAIGDPDQSIYGFRGADPDLFERFVAERPGVRRVTLARNYRSTPAILTASAGVLGGGRGGTLEAVHADALPVRWAELPTDRAEAAFVVGEIERLVGGTSHDSLRRRGAGEGEAFSFGDVAVLVRLRAQMDPLEEAFGRAGVPCRMVGGAPALARGRGKEVFRRLARRPTEEGATAAVRAVLEDLGLGPEHPAAGAWLAAAAGAGDVGRLREAAALRTPEDDHDPRAERVTVLTLHAAKGLEFPVVFVAGCEEGLVPWAGGNGRPPGDPAEERRLLYVGMTRARQLLYLTAARRRVLYGSLRRPAPSRFLADRKGRWEVVRTAGAGDEGKGRARNRQLDLL